MQTLNIKKIRNMLGQLDALLDTSGEIIITKHGKAIARILPIQKKQLRPTHKDLHQLTQKLLTPSQNILREERND